VCEYVCQSIYEPGKRHWLKIKKDYLADGTMADTADLVVLGAYFGTGGKGSCELLHRLTILQCVLNFWLVINDERSQLFVPERLVTARHNTLVHCSKGLNLCPAIPA